MNNETLYRAKEISAEIEKLNAEIRTLKKAEGTINRDLLIERKCRFSTHIGYVNLEVQLSGEDLNALILRRADELQRLNKELEEL